MTVLLLHLDTVCCLYYSAQLIESLSCPTVSKTFDFCIEKQEKQGAWTKAATVRKTHHLTFSASNLHNDVSVENQKEKLDGISDCDDGVADKHQRRRNKSSCDKNYRSHAVLLWAVTVHSIVQATQNSAALLAKSSTWGEKKKDENAALWLQQRLKKRVCSH